MQQHDELGEDSDLEEIESESEGKSDSDVEEVPNTPTKKRRARGELSRAEKKQAGASSANKTFQTSWLSDSKFKGWLKADKKGNPLYSLCTACDQRIKGGKSELEKHMKRSKHKKNIKKVTGVRNIAEAFAGNATRNQHTKNVKEAEIRIAALFADNNFAVSAVGEVLGVMKKAAKDSAIVKDITLERTKCSALIRNVVAATEIEETVKNIRETPFTVLVDESPDIAHKKNFCILVKYMHKGKTRLDLLELLELDARDCSAEKVFSLFLGVFQKHDVPLTNCAALACDNANVMIGNNNSFYSRLKSICPWLVLLNCVCHCSAIAASHACAKLPANVKKVLQQSTTFINSSPKRTAELEEFAQFHDEEHKTLVKLSFTRWLVLHSCIVRFLELHKTLVQFFTMADFEDRKRETSAHWILSELNNPFTMAYLKFLKYALEFFNKFNALFQTKDTLIHRLSRSSELILKQICQNYVSNSYLSQVATLNLTSPHIQVNFNLLCFIHLCF